MATKKKTDTSIKWTPGLLVAKGLEKGWDVVPDENCDDPAYRVSFYDCSSSEPLEVEIQIVTPPRSTDLKARQDAELIYDTLCPVVRAIVKKFKGK